MIADQQPPDRGPGRDDPALTALGFACTLEQLVRSEGARVLATMRRLTGDLDKAEDAVADACVAALESWPVSGIPQRPGAWLTTVARRKAIDRIRRESHRGDVEAAAVGGLESDEPISYHDVRDDQLRLIFTCCHPALSREAQVALALRLLCGLSTVEIAHAFLEREATIGQRISRAKSKIAANRIAYRIPGSAELPDRLAGVLAVIQLMFTTGHHAPVGPTIDRIDLASEAIRLAELVASLMPDEPEALGLTVLLQATWARPRRMDRFRRRVRVAPRRGPFEMGSRRRRRRFATAAIGTTRRAAGALPDPGRVELRAFVGAHVRGHRLG